MARFLDSSIFLHSYLKAKRKLTEREIKVKEAAKEVLRRVEEGEEVVTTVVHVSEIANIIESRIGLRESLQIVSALLTLPNIKVVEVTPEDYRKALPTSTRYGVSINDSIAYLKMTEMGIREAYSTDKHFKQLPNIKTLPEI